MILRKVAILGCNPLLILGCCMFSASSLKGHASDQTSSPTVQMDPLQRPRPSKRPTSKEERAYKQWLDEDVKYIISDGERDAFKKLSNDAERASFVEHFWDVRNPHPESGHNEFKEEHYRRIAFANERFAAGMPGWKTDRGRIYIMHGPPASIEAHPAGGPYTRSAEEGGGQTVTYPFEVWHYRNIEGAGQNIDLEFVDTCGCGDYHLTIDRGEKDISNNVPGMGPTDLEAMGLARQADRRRGVETLGPSLFGNNQSKEFDRITEMARVNAPPPAPPGVRARVTATIRTNLLPFDVRVDFVKGDANTVFTPVTIQVPNRELSYVAKDGVQRAMLNLSGSVTRLTGRVVATFEQPLRLDVAVDQLEAFAANVSLYQEALTLRPGLYRLDVMLKDLNGDKLGIFAHSIRVPDFSDEDKLSSSTLILADLVDPVPPREIGVGKFVLGSNKVRPHVPPANGEPATFVRAQKVNLWMQVYNLALDKATQQPSAKVEYSVVNVATGKPVFELATSTEQMSNPGRQLTLQQRLPADRFEPGVYQVRIKVSDLVAHQEIAPDARFALK